MEGLQELLQEQKRIYDETQSILKAAIAEKRSLTDEEDARYEANGERLTGLKILIARAHELGNVGQELEQFSSRAAYGASTPPSHEERSGRDRVVAAPKQNQHFRSLGEHCLAVAKAGITGRHDPRLIELRDDGMYEGVPSEGGYLVQHERLGEVLKRAFESARLASRCRKLPVGPNSTGFTWTRFKDDSRATGSRHGGLRVYWMGEGEAFKFSKLGFEEGSIKLQKLGAMIKMTDELMSDAVQLEGMIREFLPEEFAFELDDSILYGKGVAKPQGILESAVLLTVAKESGQAAKTIVYENISKMELAFHESIGSQGVYFVNKNTKPQLEKLYIPVGTAGNGELIYKPGTGQNGIATLNGRPVVEIEHAETLGTKGDIILADMRQYWLVEKGDLQVDSSMHVYFDTAEHALRFMKRVNGRASVDKPITPYKGEAGEKRSPFVVLANRA